MDQTSYFRLLSIAFVFTVSILFSSCDDDPAPVNEEEVITTLNVVLTPVGPGANVTLQFKDLDGSGSTMPVKSVIGPIIANKTYNAVIALLNESGSTPIDITAEVQDESADHLFCFSTTGNLTATASDTDSNGLPIGLSSTWVTGSAGAASIKITLRHQPDTKTGLCPGSGETDAEVDFDLTIQ